MKKTAVLLLLFFWMLFTHKVHAAITGEHIGSFDSNITVNKDGTINVKETIVYDFDDFYRHGIYRTIPFIKKNNGGKKFMMDLQVASVTDEKGNRYSSSLMTSGNNVQIKIGDPDRTITGIHTYIISYKVLGALTYFSDHDELYWNATGNDWNVPIEQVNATVELPATVGESDITIACYTGLYGESGKSCETSKKGNTAVIHSTNLLSANQGVTIVSGFPKGIVSVLEPKEVVPFSQTLQGKIVTLLMILLATFWYLIYPIKIIYKWFKYGRDPSASSGQVPGVVTAWFDPPKNPKGNRFLTPGEVGTLGDETADLKDISATIIDLARRGYLRIEERTKGDFYFVSTKPASAKASAGEGGLLAFEKKLLSGIFESGKTIRLKDENLYETVEDVKKSLYEDTVDEGLFRENPQPIRTFYSVIDVLGLVTLNFFLAAVAFIFGRNMPRKTVEGVNAFTIAKSLKNFLTSQERQLAFQADRQMMFEKLLPFAIAFGVERIWAKRFATIDLREPNWYQGYGYTHFNSMVFVNSMNSSFSTFRSSATPTQSTSGFSSGFSGGFSGGGGGGGGGGSW